MKLEHTEYQYFTWVPPYYLQKSNRNFEGFKMADPDKYNDDNVQILFISWKDNYSALLYNALACSWAVPKADATKIVKTWNNN